MHSAPQDSSEIHDLAAAHGLMVNTETMSVIELGLDFRVVMADVADDIRWVLRIPRRPDVTARAAIEGRLLERVAPHLDVAVPDWRVHTAELIAYPLLPGEPGLTLDTDGNPVWHFNAESAVFAHSLADFLAELHGIDSEQVHDTGIEMRTPAESRQAIRDDIERVSAEFAVAPQLRERWTAWLADDRFWPEWSVLTHGETYPAHLLLRDERIVGVLDWTTAAVGDPARDFMFHQASVSPATFDATVRRYQEHGGRVWPMLAEHCAELFSMFPVNYGLYALETGDPVHAEAAAAQLSPPSI